MHDTQRARQAVHERPRCSGMRGKYDAGGASGLSGNRRKDCIFRQKERGIWKWIEAGMEVPEEINQDRHPYTVMQMDQDGIVRYSTNPVIICGQQLSAELPERGSYCMTKQEGYQIMIYRSRIGYMNAAALPADICQKEVRLASAASAAQADDSGRRRPAAGNAAGIRH